MSTDGRIVVWFSCGAPSAVATKLCVAKGPCEIVYTQVKEEHEDNARFLKDCEGWLGRSITILRNEKYDASIYKVFEKERYLKGISGAPCTKLLKRRMREYFQRPNDVHVLGYTIEEKDRLEQFKAAFPELSVSCPLIDRGLSKADCLAMIERAGIKLPAMYLLGYNNNNCIGCVKGGMGYWNKIRIDFPDVYVRMAATERLIGHSINRRHGAPMYLDEMPMDAGAGVPEPKIDCSIVCLTTIQEYAG